MSVTWQNVKGFVKCLLNPRACSATKKLLYEFVEEELDPPTHDKLAHHLSDCPECLRYVDTYKRTIELTHQHGPPDAEMPEVLCQKLHEFIQQNPQLR